MNPKDVIIETEEDLLKFDKEHNYYNPLYTINNLTFKNVNLNILDIFMFWNIEIGNITFDNVILGNLEIFKIINKISIINIDINDNYTNQFLKNNRGYELELVNNNIINLSFLKYNTFRILTLKNNLQVDLNSLKDLHIKNLILDSYENYKIKDLQILEQWLKNEKINIYDLKGRSIKFDNLEIKNNKELNSLIRKIKIEKII